VANVSRYTQLYNEEFKLRWLSNIGLSESTYDMYIKTFKRTHNMEKHYNKDLYQFSLNEMVDLLKSFRFKSEQAASTRMTPISQYISFAIEEGYTENNLNTIDMIRANKNVYSSLVNSIATQQKTITRNKLYQYCNRMKNAQDAICWILPFEGILGKEMKDIINITKDDIDLDSNLIEIEDRIVILSDESTWFVKTALEEDFYFKGNGKYDGGKYNNQKRFLQKNRYLVRSTSGQKDAFIDNPVLKGTIAGRLQRTSKALGRPHITPTDLYNSGVRDFIYNYLNNYKYKDFDNKDEEFIRKSKGFHKLCAEVTKKYDVSDIKIFEIKQDYFNELQEKEQLG
jgi:hypothetical protein